MSATTIAILSVLIAIGSLLLTILNYSRQRRIDNENHNYKLLIEVYNTLIGELTDYIDEFERACDTITLLEKDEVEMTSAEYSGLVNKLDCRVDRLSTAFSKNQLLIPATTADKLEDLLDTLTFTVGENPYTEDTLKEFLEEVYTSADEMVNLFRKDLNIEGINRSLFHRTK
jgi:hypothetical protein